MGTGRAHPSIQSRVKALRPWYNGTTMHDSHYDREGARVGLMTECQVVAARGGAQLRCTHAFCDDSRCRFSYDSVLRRAEGPGCFPVGSIVWVEYNRPDCMGLATPVLGLCVQHANELDGTQLDIC